MVQNSSNTTDKPRHPIFSDWVKTPLLPNQGWVFCLLSIVIIISYMPTVLSLHQRWIKLDEAYSHGYAGIALTAYYLWSRRQEVFSHFAKPQLHLLVPLASSTLLLLCAQLSYTALVSQFLLPVLLLTGFATVYGLSSCSRILPYVALLYFTIPIWDYLSPFLQQLTIIVSTFTLSLMDISAYIHENYIQITKGTFNVASGCSGLNYFMVTLFTATVYILEFRLNIKQAVQMLLMATFFGLVSNWVRVTSLIILGYLTDISHPIIQDHFLHGWLISAGFIFLMFVIASFIILQSSSTDKHKTDDQDSQQGPSHSRWKPLIALISVITIIAMPFYVGPIAKLFSPSLIPTIAQYDTDSTINTSKSQHFNGWEIRFTDKLAWHPKLQNADFTINQHWFNGYESMEVSITGYQVQAQGRELINSENHTFDPSWQWQSESQSKTFGDAIIQTSNGENYAIRYWFQIGREPVLNTLKVKLLSALGNLTGVSNGVFILLKTRCRDDCKQATDLLDNDFSQIKLYIDDKVLGIGNGK